MPLAHGTDRLESARLATRSSTLSSRRACGKARPSAYGAATSMCVWGCSPSGAPGRWARTIRRRRRRAVGRSRCCPTSPPSSARCRARFTPPRRPSCSRRQWAGRWTERFVEKHWRRALRAAGLRPRKFYATRHTFISVAVSTPGVSMKWVADYCGTSVEMIERHYARYLHDNAGQLALLGAARRRRRSPQPASFRASEV